MKKLLIFASLIASLKLIAQESREIFFADPTVYVENDTYYLTGTKNREPLGFAILESKNLKEWISPSSDSLHMILNKGDETFGTKGFWAPQLFKAQSEYHLTYTANEQTVLAKSKYLMGPYVQQKVMPIDSSAKNIDSYLFKDEDGKYYLYHVRFDKGNYLWVAEFDFTAGKIKQETLTRCFTQTQDWEATPAYNSNPIMEGPTVIRLKDKYYLFYSANHFMSPDYAVGYAVADSPMGPWRKYGANPIIHNSIVGESGSGHGDLFTGIDGLMYYVYHVHYSEEKVSPRRTRIVPVRADYNSDTQQYDFRVLPENILVPVIKN